MTDVKKANFMHEKGLELLVSHNPKTFKRVGKLLLAVNRVNELRRLRELRDPELCSLIMKHVVEETIVANTSVDFSNRLKAWQCNSSEIQCTLCCMLQQSSVIDSGHSNGVKTFRRVDSETECTLVDKSSQKSLILGSETLNLQAVTLKSGQEHLEVSFKLSRYVCSPSLKGQLVRLSIDEFSLACSMNGDKPELNLEKCCQLCCEALNTISEDKNMHRFLFQRRDSGKDITTFESFSCPGWFISTSSVGQNQPVVMAECDTSFTMIIKE